VVGNYSRTRRSLSESHWRTTTVHVLQVSRINIPVVV